VAEGETKGHVYTLGTIQLLSHGQTQKRCSETETTTTHNNITTTNHHQPPPTTTNHHQQRDEAVCSALGSFGGTYRTRSLILSKQSLNVTKIYHLYRNFYFLL
jgi:hypothetical protein